MIVDIQDLPIASWTNPHVSEENFLANLNTPSPNRYRVNRLAETPKLKHVQNNLIANSEVYHRNYLEYLECCWGTHYGVILSPEIIWHVLMCELAQIVKDDPETYRYLFSESKEKQELIVESGSWVLPLDAIMSLLDNLIPSGIKKDVLVDFTTSTDRSRFVLMGTFADMASPFYNYSMLLCGITKVDMRGTEEDWMKLYLKWKDLRQYFPAESEYFDEVAMGLHELVKLPSRPLDERKNILKGMFYLERCGSGSDKEVCGWIADFFKKKPSPAYLENFPSNVSVVEYKELSTGFKFQMNLGLFSSNIQDGFLVPSFAFVVYQKIETPSVVVEKEPQLTIESEEVTAKPRKLEKEWLTELDKEILKEMRMEIDKEIIK